MNKNIGLIIKQKLKQKNINSAQIAEKVLLSGLTMSDPAKDAAIRRNKQNRLSVYEKYTPVVLWIQPRYNMQTGDGVVDDEEMTRRRIRNDAKELFNVKVATNEPRISKIVTEFDNNENE